MPWTLNGFGRSRSFTRRPSSWRRARGARFSEALHRRCDKEIDALRDRFKKENRPLDKRFDEQRKTIKDRCEKQEKALNGSYDKKKKDLRHKQEALHGSSGDKERSSKRDDKFEPATGDLPPGLEKYEEKHGGKLPPGLQKQLEKKGQLPPGLEKR